MSILNLLNSMLQAEVMGKNMHITGERTAFCKTKIETVDTFKINAFGQHVCMVHSSDPVHQVYALAPT